MNKGTVVSTPVPSNRLPSSIKKLIDAASLPANYSRLKQEIAECFDIEALKEVADRSLAIATYYKQAEDVRDTARRLHIRAHIQIGELLNEIEPSRGKPKFDPVSKLARGGQSDPASRTSVRKRAGLSPEQAGKAMALARVPREQREQLIDQSPPISKSRLAQLAPPSPSRPQHAFQAGAAYRKAAAAGGIVDFSAWTRRNDAYELGRALTADEAERLRPHLRQIEAWVDDFDRASKAASSSEGSK